MHTRKHLLFLILVFLLLIPAACSSQPEETYQPNLVLVLEADGPVSTAMADYLERGLTQASENNAEALVLMLNTPGGAVDIMNRMVRDIRNSQIPVIVYVAPRGSMAASAGTIVTLAGHVSAMAPETTIGAASPVDFQGQDIGETAERKEKEMLRATVRTLTSGRSTEAVALAEDTIENARAVSAEEALQYGLIDIISEDIDNLLAQTDGLIVTLPEQIRRLDTTGAQVEYVPESFIDSLLSVLANPNVVFLLLNIGILAILIEISSPGGWLAGFIGVVCLVLAVYGLGVLPVNWFGLIFIVIAFVLFVLDLKAPTHGLLIAAGIGTFIVGALILFNTVRPPEFQPVSIPLIVISALFSGLIFAVILGFAIRAQKTPIKAGYESFVGRTGTVRESLDPRGQVQVSGELWTAEVLPGEDHLMRGEKIIVVEVDGVRLRVRRSGTQPPNAELKNSANRL